MSIAEKLQIIAENEQKVYNVGKTKGYAEGYSDGDFNGYQSGYENGLREGTWKGIEQGKQDGKTELLTDSKYMNANVSGTVIAVNDVNAIEHNVSVKLTSETITDFSNVEVSRLGKNLALAEDVYKNVNLFSVVEFEGRTAVRFLDNIEARWAGISFKPNTQYTVSFEARITKREEIDTKPTALFYFFYSDGTKSRVFGYRNTEWEHFTLTSDAGKTVVALGMDSYGYYNFPYIDCNSFQLEEGSTATAYEPYNRTIYQSTADGTVEGVTSISPNMTLLTNNNGVSINCNYLRDIDLYIDNLTTNVALTGGE